MTEVNLEYEMQQYDSCKTELVVHIAGDEQKNKQEFVDAVMANFYWEVNFAWAVADHVWDDDNSVEFAFERAVSDLKLPQMYNPFVYKLVRTTLERRESDV